MHACMYAQQSLEHFQALAVRVFLFQLPLCSGQCVLCQKPLLQSIDNKLLILLQSMPRPFTKLKELDMDELAKEITASA